MVNSKLLDRAEQPMVVVDNNGNPTGKIVRRADAHSSPGIKHLAFIVFVINSKNEFVLHKRSGKKVGENKLDSPVSHVLSGETIEQAVHRCLEHEYGIKENVKVLNLGGFPYEKDYGDGTCENEYCLALVVEFDGKIVPNPEEMDGTPIFLPIKQAIEEAKATPEKFEVWVAPAIKIFSMHNQTKRFLK